ncbi:MAG TPA: lantibiotic dehydratase [Ktedonobacteraceae bacterium]|jgi:hypothetical protein
MSDLREQQPQTPATARVLSSHLIGWGEQDWACWRDVGLRGAGFPVTHVLRLASPACATQADQVLHAQNRLEQEREEIVTRLTQAIDQAANQTRLACINMLRLVKRTPAEHMLVSKLPPELDTSRFQAASEDLRQAQCAFQETYAAATLQNSREIRQIIQDERFVEALIWQNRAVLRGSLAALRHLDPASPHQAAKRRKHEAAIASYLQRYCTKNDTIGFFGPVGWAKLTDEQIGIRVSAGPDLLASRAVYFESWPLAELARKLASNPALRPCLKPSQVPYLHLEQTTLFVPFAPPLLLPLKTALVLQACNGRRTACELATLLLNDPSHRFSSHEEIYAILDALQSENRILWTLSLPPEGPFPEKDLAQAFEKIGDESLRQEGLNALGELTRARERVAQAAGNVVALDEAIEHLEATFTRLTDCPPTRLAGHTYAARTLVYEDCRRDISLEIGAESLRALGRPLNLLLISARWFTYAVSQFYQRAFLEAYEKLSQKKGDSSVDFADFWAWTHARFFKDGASLAHTLIPLLQQRWASLLGLSGEQRRVTWTSQQLHSGVQKVFQAPAPGWRTACYHSPDILVQAADAQALQTGECTFVLGEMHIALNTLRPLCFYAQHPAPEKLMQALVADFPAPLIQPVVSPLTLPVSRTRPALHPPRDFRLLFAADACAPRSAQTLTTGDMVVERQGNDLFVLTRDRRLRFPILDLFAEFLSAATCDCFQLLAAQPHQPRVTIDNLVIARESWRFAGPDLSFAEEKEPSERFLRVRHWMQVYGLPRFVFVKTPIEQKPCFIDFESPIFVDALARLIRRTRQEKGSTFFIEISEMLPAPHECWLPDAQGNHYTSELRLVIVDQCS